MRVLLVVLLVAAAVCARDKQAAAFQSKGLALARQTRAGWKRFVLERDKVTDDEIRGLIKDLDQAAELLHKSLEIEDFAGINGQIISIAKKLVKLRFAQHIREQRRKMRNRPKPKPRPKPQPEPRDDKPAPEPEPEIKRTRGLPDLIEDKKAKRRGLQTLRNFLIHYYFANRKFATLLTRCTRCEGSAKVVIGRDGKTRKRIFATCPRCAYGAHLNLNAARKAFWLTMSPLHRADPANRAAFQDNLQKWHADPRTIGEFLTSLSIAKIDYHGLWATVTYREKGTFIVDGRQRRFKPRKVERMFVRFGKRWFVYDEKTDNALFSDSD